MDECEFQALLRRVCDGVLARILALKPSADVILEKTPDHVGSAASILALYPRAKFIHIIRDPRAVTASMLAARKDWGDDEWVPATAAGNAKRWVAAVGAGRDIANLTRDYREVRYEELKERGPAVLAPLMEWIGAPTAADECAAAIARYCVRNLAEKRVEAPWDLGKEPLRFYRRGEADGWRTELTARQIRDIEAIAGPVMRELGYKPHFSKPALSVGERVRAVAKWRLEQLARRL